MLSREQITVALKCFPQFRYWSRATASLDLVISESVNQGDEHIVASQMTLLDALYGTNLMIRRTSAENLAEYEPRFWTLVTRILTQGTRLSENVRNWGAQDSNLRNLDDSAVEKLVQVHRDLAQFNTTGEVSFVSKYLHFRFPAFFPIYDGVVREFINDRQQPKPIRDRRYEDLVHWYRKSLNEDWPQPIRDVSCRETCAPFGKTEVRLLDSLIWLAGQASRYIRKLNQQEGAGNKKISVNKEAFLFFEENRCIARLLSQRCGDDAAAGN